MPVPGSPDARCGPLVFGFTRRPARRSIGWESSAMVGYARAFVSATTCLFGLSKVCGSGSASNTAMMCCGGSAYFGGSDALGTCARSAGARMRTASAMKRLVRLSMKRSSFLSVAGPHPRHLIHCSRGPSPARLARAFALARAAGASRLACLLAAVIRRDCPLLEALNGVIVHVSQRGGNARAIRRADDRPDDPASWTSGSGALSLGLPPDLLLSPA